MFGERQLVTQAMELLLLNTANFEKEKKKKKKQISFKKLDLCLFGSVSLAIEGLFDDPFVDIIC